ncbi:Ig-like domain-containing protein, partial [Mycobacterium tuberculosis]|uniref:Ig-like domain-containing protein n=1 Tax=Mycobacterium tuberculosis TaxID=1773 RepID=UPI001AE2EA0F
VLAGTGDLHLTGSDGSTRAIDMGDRSQVTVSGNTVTINPTQDLAAGVRYAVTLDADAVRDLSGNKYAGLTDGTSFDFTVKSATTTT